MQSTNVPSGAVGSGTHISLDRVSTYSALSFPEVTTGSWFCPIYSFMSVTFD